MPILHEILGACFVVFCIYSVVRASRKAAKREELQKQESEALAANLLAVEEKLQGLEKRLTNIEMIVTDAKFVDPPTSGREAIDLKSEITELKSIIMNLQK